MELCIILFSFINFIACIVGGRYLGIKGVKWITFFCIGTPLALTVYQIEPILINKVVIQYNVLPWIQLSNTDIPFSIVFDGLSCSMLTLIFTVSFFVHIFSFSYMGEDPHFPRFLSYLSLFTFFMVILVTSGNVLQLFIGWEGVGLCSYLLINFWSTRIEANKAAIKAMVMNKIGDLGLLLGILILWHIVGALDYPSIFSCLNQLFLSNKLEWVGILMFIGVIGKSAQIGLHTWLPDAMEGPTPVSALIHAATMVTAGVFLIIRLSPLFEQLNLCSLIIVVLGSLTCITAALIALPQKDIKKVIAYSTCSQLGYMVVICGFFHYDVSLFHLINHGFFKALLFLSAGSIIHANFDEQDSRKLGALNFMTPITFSCFYIGSCSLIGLPFLSGFFSKDLILELIYTHHTLSFAFWLSSLAVLFTSLYSFKLLFSTFYVPHQNSPYWFNKIKESDAFILLPLIGLSIASIFGGYFSICLLTHETAFSIKSSIKWVPLTFCTIGLILMWRIYEEPKKWFQFKLTNIIKPFYIFFTETLFFNLVFNLEFYKILVKSGFQTYKTLDNQIIEQSFLGPQKVYSAFNTITSHSSSINNGYLSFYISMFFILTLITVYSIS